MGGIRGWDSYPLHGQMNLQPPHAATPPLGKPAALSGWNIDLLCRLHHLSRCHELQTLEAAAVPAVSGNMRLSVRVFLDLPLGPACRAFQTGHLLPGSDLDTPSQQTGPGPPAVHPSGLRGGSSKLRQNCIASQCETIWAKTGQNLTRVQLLSDDYLLPVSTASLSWALWLPRAAHQLPSDTTHGPALPGHLASVPCDSQSDTHGPDFPHGHTQPCIPKCLLIASPTWSRREHYFFTPTFSDK